MKGVWLAITLAAFPVSAAASPAGMPDPVSAKSSAGESIERRIARMLLVGISGDKAAPGGDFEKYVCGLKVGGVLLFDTDVKGEGKPRNIRSEEQLVRLTHDLQELAARCGDSPLLIAADVEGGRVNRLRPIRAFHRLKSHQWLGQRPPQRTYDEAMVMGKGLAEVGINWNLAPVVDLNLNPQNPVIGLMARSFSADPAVVSEHALAFINGLHANGILSCLKHFPGHGSSTGDTHKGTTDVTETSDLEMELEPYQTLMAKGVVDCVMTSHIYNRKIDPKDILTISSAAVTGLLRGEFAYDGLVLSDDLQMAAVRGTMKLEEAAIRAVLAGTDMITLSNNRKKYDAAAAIRVHKALVRAVAEGRIPESRIDGANRRIIALKARALGLSEEQ